MANTWYAFNGGDPTQATNYRRLTGKPGCSSGQQICAIYAPDGGLLPKSPLPANILTYITDGLHTEVPQPQTPPLTKLFVYLRNV